MEPHDSFFIGTDVFYSYIVNNGYWKLRIAQKNEDTYFSAGEQLQQSMLQGIFPEAIRDQFRRMLAYFGQSPIIIRSSSFLEDGFNNAFAGKYDSVFCANAASPDENLKTFETAVRRVYASTMDPSALEYRRSRGLSQSDEQMAILVQRVSGTRFGDYFMPCAAGIGFSYSLYRWSEDLDPNAGMLRLVAGMGTRAVDRTDGDYPRLVNLDKPERTPLTGTDHRHRFSQRNMDVIIFSRNVMESINAYDLLPRLPAWYRKIIAEHDVEAELSFYERGQARDVLFISCEGVVQNNTFIAMMGNILHTLEEQYQNPVDIEYTVNFNQDGNFVVNLVQCRPLSIWKAAETILLPDFKEADILFKVKKSFMGNTAMQQIDYVVWVDSKKYYEFPYIQKSQVVLAIDKINSLYKGTEKRLLLAVPGRIGTSSPELGIPVSFSNISNFNVICEYSDGQTGYMPELSYGSHMFQDLVESNIFYIAILENEDTLIFNKEFWNGQKDMFPEICPEFVNLTDIVKVYEVDSLALYADIKGQIALCGIVSI